MIFAMHMKKRRKHKFNTFAICTGGGRCVKVWAYIRCFFPSDQERKGCYLKKAMRKRSLLAVLLVLCMVVMLMAAAVAGTAVLYRKKAKN